MNLHINCSEGFTGSRAQPGHQDHDPALSTPLLAQPQHFAELHLASLEPHHHHHQKKKISIGK